MVSEFKARLLREKPTHLDWQSYYKKQAGILPVGPLQRFYQAGIIAADCPLNTVPMISIDLETTGLNSKKDTIISFGSVNMTSHRIQCGSAKYWMVKPSSPLLSESVTIHEITHSDIADSPDLSSCFEAILQTLSGKVVIVHCAAIERHFLYQAAKKLYGQDFYFPIIDTMALEHNILKKRPLWPRLFNKSESLRLDACRQRYRLPSYKAHHALTDAFSSAELLQAQVAHHFDHEDVIGRYWV